MTEKKTIPVSAVQLVRLGDLLKVFVETDGHWITAIETSWPSDGCGQISHITEAGLIQERIAAK